VHLAFETTSTNLFISANAVDATNDPTRFTTYVRRLASPLGN
jgi:hypothetical protein